MSPETPAERHRRAGRVARQLAAAYPDARCALDFRNSFELLVATSLSAQCTDKKGNEVTPAPFARYPTPEALAAAPLAGIEREHTELVPPADWAAYAHRVIHHGRVCCDTRHPHCDACSLAADRPWPQAREGARASVAPKSAPRLRAAEARSPRR